MHYNTDSYNIILSRTELLSSSKECLKKSELNLVPIEKMRKTKKKAGEVTIDDVVLTWSVEEELLSTTLDSELKFEKHITGICNKNSQKTHALSRITSYMSLNKRRLLVKTFIESQFNHCPLIWMFHSRRLNKKINNIYKKVLRIIYSDYKPTFQELLDKESSFSVHHRNIQTLAIEIYKHIHGLRQQLWGKLAKLTELYHLTSEYAMNVLIEFLKQ